jgi:glucosamine-6-phosphate deaminase
MPSLEGDAMPFANLIRARQPDLLTVAFDPEGTGPDTHYKVLQVVSAGLKISMQRGDFQDSRQPMIWGYRNVWFVFAPWECNVMIPVSEADLQLMHETFMSCFTTQKEASFPSPFYDGPFSAWARHLQIEQKKELEDLLGSQYFEHHADPRVRNAHGFVFLKAMHATTFLAECEGLKSKFEIV